jgi:hypothetical protein
MKLIITPLNQVGVDTTERLIPLDLNALKAEVQSIPDMNNLILGANNQNVTNPKYEYEDNLEVVFLGEANYFA